MDEMTNPSAANTETADTSASVAEFPSEPFQCPACGQLLAPTCRVCVACRKPIDFEAVGRHKEVALPAAPALRQEPPPEPVRFPWRIFFAVLGISFAIAIVLEAIWPGREQNVSMVMQGIQTLAGLWVFFDATRRHLPRPLRWALGSMLLPVVIFPWYLARRSRPRSPVPFVEAEVRPVTRFVLIALLLFLLVSLVLYLVEGPQPSTTPTPAPKLQKLGGSSQARVKYTERHNLRHRTQPHLLVPSPQPEISAPSDAWQT
jgi:hypothetical protein